MMADVEFAAPLPVELTVSLLPALVLGMTGAVHARRLFVMQAALQTDEALMVRDALAATAAAAASPASSSVQAAAVERQRQRQQHQRQQERIPWRLRALRRRMHAAVALFALAFFVPIIPLVVVLASGRSTEAPALWALSAFAWACAAVGFVALVRWHTTLRTRVRVVASAAAAANPPSQRAARRLPMPPLLTMLAFPVAQLAVLTAGPLSARLRQLEPPRHAASFYATFVLMGAGIAALVHACREDERAARTVPLLAHPAHAASTSSGRERRLRVLDVYGHVHTAGDDGAAEAEERAAEHAAFAARARQQRRGREEGAGLVARWTYAYLDSFIRAGYGGPLQPADVDELPRSADVALKHARLRGLMDADDEAMQNAGGTGNDGGGDDDAVAAAAALTVNDASTLSRERRVRVSKRRLMRALWRLTRPGLLWGGAFKLVGDTLGFVNPLMLHALLTYVAHGDEALPAWAASLGSGYAYGLVAVMTASTVGRSLFLHRYLYHGRLQSLAIRVALRSLLFEKALRTSLRAHGAYTRGKLVNVFATDVNRVEQVFVYGVSLLAVPVQLIIAIAILVSIVGYAALVGVGLILVLTPLQTALYAWMARTSKRVLAATDRRVDLVGEVLQAVRAIKCAGWDAAFRRLIGEARAAELRWLWRIKLAQVADGVMVLTTPMAIALLTFFAYTRVSDEPLTPAKAFSTLTIFSLIKQPLQMLPQLVRIVVEGNISLGRLAGLLSLEEVHRRVDGPRHQLQQQQQQQQQGRRRRARPPSVTTPPGAIRVHGDFRFHPSSPEPTLRVNNLVVPAGAFAVVVGRVGAGKSFFLHCLLGEAAWAPTPRAAAAAGSPRGGAVVPPSFITSSVAFAPQEPWLTNASVRSNVIFGLPFRGAEYAAAVRACCLNADFAELPAGDRTEVGERGITLSGGQKARLSLARVLYRCLLSDAKRAALASGTPLPPAFAAVPADVDVVLMDDPLAALDAQVGSVVVHRVLLGLLAHKTRVLVTHHVGVAAHADLVVMMENAHEADADGGTAASSSSSNSGTASGQVDAAAALAQASAVRLRITGVGACDTLARSHPPFAAMLAHDAHAQQQAADAGGAGRDVPLAAAAAAAASDTVRAAAAASSLPAASATGTEDDVGALVKAEERAVGAVAWCVYAAYGRARGWLLVGATAAALVCVRGTQTASDMWLLHWSNANVRDADASTAAAPKAQTSASDDADYYVGVYAWIGLGMVAIVALSRMLDASATVRASRNLHARLLRGVLGAPVSFFDTTPQGRLLNRFSRDVDSIDTELPEAAMGLAANVLDVVGMSIVIAYFVGAGALALLPVLLLFAAVRGYYSRTSVEIKRLAAVSKSPMFAHMASTLDGIATARAFGAERHLTTEMHAHLTANLEPMWQMQKLNRWLGVRLSALAALVLACVGVLALRARDAAAAAGEPGGAGEAGVLLTYAIAFTAAFSALVRASIDTEQRMNAVERVSAYATLPAEEARTKQPRVEVDAAWPRRGRVEFEGVDMRYREGTPLVLRSVGAVVEGGSRVGVAGRTGSGKSSLVTLLFRTVECAAGRVLIDGVDIARVPLALLRRRLAIIPQQPVLFTGSVRTNLDPFGESPDAELWGALAACRLDALVRAMPGGLEARVDGGGANFSAGQRQLVCMARALLRRARIIVCDEATASIDFETDALIQDMLRTHFRDATVITIAHRVATILDYDQILVLDAGRVVEAGPPRQLLRERPDGLFARLVAAAGAGGGDAVEPAAAAAAPAADKL